MANDKKQLVLDIKEWLEQMDEVVDMPISEQRARQLLEDCFEVIK